MTSYVLVHGGAHGGWCWERLTPYLEADARVDRVVALDLPGHGQRVDERDLNEITLEDYIEDIAGTVRRLDLRDVVLVGHSLAGASMPQAAARVADRVKRAVFLSALIPGEGKSSLETIEANRTLDLPRGGDMSEQYRSMFCNDEDDETARWHLSKLGPQPPAIMTAKVSRAGFPQDLPSTYIVLLKDQALAPSFQRELLKNLPDPEVVELDAGHSAMVSKPKELADILLRYA